MKKIILSVLFTALLQITAYADEIEAFFGAEYTSYSDYSDYNTAGISARVKYNMYNSDQGFFVFSNFKGESLFNFDALFGYGIRSSGNLFFEAGGGLWYSFYFGSGYGGILSAGLKLTGQWYVTLPLIIRLGGLEFMQIAPMIGMRF